jgi:hypothetical protein
VAGGLASAPTITMAALVYLVFSRPLLTPGAFMSYVFWKASDLAQHLVSLAAGLVTENATLMALWETLGPVARSPLFLGLGGLVLSLLSAGALWILYRNLIVTSSDARYARARV